MVFQNPKKNEVHKQSDYMVTVLKRAIYVIGSI